jgi:hypothetical protein
VASLAAASSGALAASLDKSACNDLSAELSGIVAAGTRADMAQGPEWALANLPPEKLASIRRLIEVEEQLEFRCGSGRNRIAATSPSAPSPAKRSEENVPIPDSPEKKPAGKSSATKSIPVPDASSFKPAADVVKPAPEPASTAASITAAAAPPEKDVPGLGPTPGSTATPEPADVAKTAAAPPEEDVPGLGPTPGSMAAPKAPNAPKTAAAVSPATASKPVVASGASAAAPKPRRQSSSAYMSPADVNPNFLTRYGDAE